MRRNCERDTVDWGMLQHAPHMKWPSMKDVLAALCRDMPELGNRKLPHPGPLSLPSFPPLLAASFSSLPEPPPPLQVAPLTDNRSPVLPASRKFSFG